VDAIGRLRGATLTLRGVRSCVDPSVSAEILYQALLERDGDGGWIGIGAAEHHALLDGLLVGLDGRSMQLVASISPIPVEVGLAPSPVVYAVKDGNQLPPPTVATPCAQLCLLSKSAAALAARSLPPPTGTALEFLKALAPQLVQLGYRHVAAPGVAYGWTSQPAPQAEPDWAAGYRAALDSDANALLSGHRLWARTRLRPTRVVVDGACIERGTHTGSQRLVLEISKALARRRNTAEVSLAVSGDVVPDIRRLLAGTGVDVVERSPSTHGFDVVYRPYQILRVGEYDWCIEAGERLVLGQLDMIGFTNPSYHPSPQLFAFARNLQRKMLHGADAITFISEFGRASTMIECPTLEVERTFVVSCGADAEVGIEARPSRLPAGRRFVAMTSATFSHKNRPFALEVFGELCRQGNDDLLLVIAGPEPFYGRSTAAEQEMLVAMPESVSSRVIYLGQVSEEEKWWLLRHAEAVLYPSVVEGFGLVPFEAMAVGTPSLSYLGTALADVLGEGPATVSSWSASEWVDRLVVLLGDAASRSANLDQVRGAAAVHTWDRCAMLTWESIDAALAMVPRSRGTEEGSWLSRTEPMHEGIGRGTQARVFAIRAHTALRRRLRVLAGRLIRSDAGPVAR
jgi:glycosyltransferase involved in cell wall biosynthesis